MSRHDVGSWIRSFSIFRPTYSRLPEGDENGATTEKAHASRSATRSHWKSTLLRYSPAVIIPLLILLALLFARRPILDTLHPTKFSDDPGADVYVNPDKTHYVPLKPGTFDSDQPYRKALVLASFSKQHVEWLSELNDDWEIYRYVLDNSNPISGLTVPRNQGREAMAYLTYIIDHYDDLPDYIVFHHGHRRAWHQPEPTAMKLRALNLTALAHDHYINFRCAHDPGCTSDTGIDLVHVDPEDDRVQAHMLPKFWNTMFGNESVWDMGPPPLNVSVGCCAQFAVAKDAILARPLSFWRTYRRPLERDLDEYKQIWGPRTSSYTIGICYEKLWHMVFGKSSEHCPSEDYCRGTQFSDAIVCDRYTGQFDDVKDNWMNIKCMEKWQDG